MLVLRLSTWRNLKIVFHKVYYMERGGGKVSASIWLIFITVSLLLQKAAFQN